ncbi:hypothetical protein ACFSTA_16575 [Ornithinibacillus salinisoli]|uniref:ABC-2 transporter permease n=1 Tax=Ornithinibacillus salinisoli TaxID=1848459 RepID=A0ABW4W2J0_9BACI
MLGSWKQAKSIAFLEWKMSFWKSIFSLLIVFTVYTSLILFTYSMSDRAVGIADVLFILLFTFVPTWCKPKEFQYQQINGNLWASPSIVMIQNLPITKDVIIKSRLILYFFHSFPIQLLTLVLIYILSEEIQLAVSPVSYFVFIIIWLSFGIYVGYGVVTTDTGTKASHTGKLTVFLGFFVLIALLLLVASFPIFFQHGIVEWSMIIAQRYPFLSTTISIVFVCLGIQYWKAIMKKTMNQVDYL